VSRAEGLVMMLRHDFLSRSNWFDDDGSIGGKLLLHFGVGWLCSAFFDEWYMSDGDGYDDLLVIPPADNQED
jgi:hypothetical protein